MQGLITFDFGNSNPHAGIFHKVSGQWELLKTYSLKNKPFNVFQDELSSLKLTPHNTSFVVAQVKPSSEFIHQAHQNGYCITSLSQYRAGEKFFGMNLNYASTLGEDRLIEAFYAYRKKASTLLINAGTYTTVDVVNSNGFCGGYIIPSYENYLSVFNQSEILSSYLKNQSVSENLHFTLPKNSTDALLGGYTSFYYMVEKLIHQYQVEKIILSGGKLKTWSNVFSTSPYSERVEKIPHLIHFSLCEWFSTQIEPF